MSKTFLVIFMILFLLSTSAHAENTATFVQKAGVSNIFEILSSKVAISQSSNQKVKQFARMMIKDHAKIFADLKKALAESGLNITPPKILDDAHNKKMETLKSANNSEFDKKYIEMQLIEHKEIKSLFENYAINGENSKLRDFASKTLLTILDKHTQHIEKISENAY